MDTTEDVLLVLVRTIPDTLNRGKETQTAIQFFHFPGAVGQNERRQMWIKAYHRGDSFVCTKDSYICSLHFLGGNGPTNPDLISAVASKERVRLSICAFITLFVV